MDLFNFFEPIRIGTNINTLRRATILETYISQTISEAGRVCSICQNVYENGDIVRKINHCSHFYHHRCLDQWLENNTKCPECQFDLREDNHQNSENTTTTTTTPTNLSPSQPTGIPSSNNHTFNNPNHNNIQSNPYLQMALQQRINEILRSRNNNETRNTTIQSPNFFAIPIFHRERERHENHQDILHEINHMRTILNNTIINSLNTSSSSNSSSPRHTNSQNHTQHSQTIPSNIQQIINSISNSISSDTTENPTIEVEYYYQNENSPTIQRITQQIERPNETRNTQTNPQRPPPSLTIEIENNNEEDTQNNESEQEVRHVSIKDNNAKKEKKYRRKIKTEYIYSSSEDSDNSDDEKESQKINRKESTKDLIKELTQKINSIEEKLTKNDPKNIKSARCSLFGCWKK